MKRWGFHGMPATHGVTKTHRRPGCIGMGRNRRVQKGKKLPGHVGYRSRVARGLEVFFEAIIDKLPTLEFSLKTMKSFVYFFRFYASIRNTMYFT